MTSTMNAHCLYRLTEGPVSSSLHTVNLATFMVNRNTCLPWESSTEDLESRQELLFSETVEQEETGFLKMCSSKEFDFFIPDGDDFLLSYSFSCCLPHIL